MEPISVALEGTTWSGAGLTADAKNGPLTLMVPSGYQSSFVVEGDEQWAGELQGEHLRQCTQDVGRRAPPHRIWQCTGDDPAIDREWAGFRAGIERENIKGQEFRVEGHFHGILLPPKMTHSALADKI